jgi:hypothetical protein
MLEPATAAETNVTDPDVLPGITIEFAVTKTLLTLLVIHK